MAQARQTQLTLFVDPQSLSHECEQKTKKIKKPKKNLKKKNCRSTALYSSSPRNRSTSSSICKAGALVSPSSCLDGEPHGWVPEDTHSTPVPSMTGEAVGGLSNFTSPIDHRKVRNPYMVAEQEFRTTTPEPASSAQRQSATQSEAAAPATTVSNNDKALKRCWRIPRWSHPSVRRTQQPSRRATRLASKTQWRTPKSPKSSAQCFAH